MKKPTASTSMEYVSLSPKGLCDLCKKEFLFPVMEIYIYIYPPVVDEETETREVE